LRNSWAVLLGLGALLALSLVFGLAVGSAVDPGWEIIISIRLPRVVLGLLVGAALGTAGAMLQALLHNPLADPFVLGISGGAALGGVTALGVGGSIGIATLSIPLAAFVGALLATLLLYVVAGRAGAGPSHALLLTGVIFNAFASSLIILITSLLDSSGITSVFLWLIGSIRHVDVWMIGAVGVLLCLGLMAGIREAYALNLISQGEETALHLGVDVARTRRRVLLATAGMIGAAVAVAGLVGFVGLIAPHLIRLLSGPDHRSLIPASALLGGSLVLIADSLGRSVLAPTELPVGAFTAILGGPLFLFLLRRELRRLNP